MKSFWKTVKVAAANGLIESLRNAVEAREVRIEHHVRTPDQVDAALQSELLKPSDRRYPWPRGRCRGWLDALDAYSVSCDAQHKE